MGDNPEQQKFEWALKNGDMDQVKLIVGKVIYYYAGAASEPSGLARCGQTFPSACKKKRQSVVMYGFM